MFSDGFWFVIGMAVAVATVWLVMGLCWFVFLFACRFMQAGRKGYGFEKTGWARWVQAWRLLVKFDLGIGDKTNG